MKNIHLINRLIMGFIILNIIWFVASIILESRLLPNPLIVYSEWIKIFPGILSTHLFYSLRRILYGFLLAFGIGLPLGVCMGYYPKVDKLFSPLIYFLYPIPKIAFIPLIMIAFGLGELSKVFIIFLVVVFQILVASRDSVMQIDKENMNVLKTLGANDIQMMKVVILPAILLKVLTSMRIALATAISVLFFSENFGTTYGLGYYIMESMQRLNYVQMYCGILTLSLVGVIIFYSIDYLEHKIA